MRNWHDDLEDRNDKRIEEGIRRYKEKLDEVFDREAESKEEDKQTRQEFDKIIIYLFLDGKTEEEVMQAAVHNIDNLSQKHDSLLEEKNLPNKRNYLIEYVRDLKKTIFAYTTPNKKILKEVVEHIEDIENADAVPKTTQTTKKIIGQRDIFDQVLSDDELTLISKIVNRVLVHLGRENMDKSIGRTSRQIVDTFNKDEA